MRYLFTILTVLCLQVAAAQQLEPIQTDRPDQTECPFIVPVKYFQAEIGFAYEKMNRSDYSILSPTCLFKYGVSEKTELRLITEIETVRSSSGKNTGLNPVTVGFKTNIAKEKGLLPMISFIGHLTLAHVAGSKNKNDYYAPSFRFTMQHTLSQHISLGYNLGAEWDGFTPEPTFIYTVTTGISLSNKLGSFVELYGFAPQKNMADHRFDAGLTYLAANNILIDLAGGFGISSNAPPYFIGLGFSFRFK